MGKDIRLQPAVLLHSRPYRETSAFLEFFTEDYGRVSVLAKGLRGKRPRFRGLCQPGQRILISWTEVGAFAYLKDVEAQKMLGLLTGRHLTCLLYCHELLLRLLEKSDPHPALFSAYQQVLEGLAERQAEEPVLRRFEKVLLDEIGFGSTFSHEAETFEPIAPQQHYVYRHGLGFVAADSLLIQAHPDRCFSGAALAEMAKENFSADEVRQTAKRFFRLILKELLGERPLQTRMLLT